MAMAGCMPGQGEGASPSATGEGCAREVSGPRGASARFSPGAIRYAVPVMAPDACHKAAHMLDHVVASNSTMTFLASVIVNSNWLITWNPSFSFHDAMELGH